jgi:hypothetical protein
MWLGSLNNNKNPKKPASEIQGGKMGFKYKGRIHFGKGKEQAKTT